MMKMPNERVRHNPPERVEYDTPDVEIFEDDQALSISADLPGVAPGRLEVSLDDGHLTVIGRVESATNGTPAESTVGRVYRRRFALADPSRFDTDHVSAVLRQGVLELRLPKTEKAKPRQIAVTVN
jgi:HSP20 family molecular chaperone IbpA